MSNIQRSKLAAIPGTRPSLQNGQLRASTGNASIDAIFSGGLPLGSVWLIEEDRYAVYSRALQRYFLGEGALHRHSMLVVNLEEDPKEFITKIPLTCAEPTKVSTNKSPAPSDVDSIGGVGGDGVGGDDLRIAWRYNGLGKVDAEQRTVNATHNFDLTTNISGDHLAGLPIDTCGLSQCLSSYAADSQFQGSYYGEVLRRVHEQIRQQQQPAGSADNTTTVQLLRICISGLGGPLWYTDDGSRLSSDLCRFLTVLRALVRQSPAAVCCISMPTHLLQYHDERLIRRVRNHVDYALQLESFAGSERETNPIFAEYHGLLHIRRLCALNTLAAGVPATHDLAFKLRRRQFVVEKLHLPPELQESGDGSGGAPATMSCGSAGDVGGAAVLDF